MLSLQPSGNVLSILIKQNCTLGNQNIAVLMLVIPSIGLYSIMWKHICLLDAKTFIKNNDHQIVKLVVIIIPDHIQLSALRTRSTALPTAFDLIPQASFWIICIIALLRDDCFFSLYVDNVLHCDGP